MSEHEAANEEYAAYEQDRDEQITSLLRENKALRAELEQAQAQKNVAYGERDLLIVALTKLFPSSLEDHEGAVWEDEWRNVVIIDLPTGQVSWHIHFSEESWFAHLPRGVRKWDGHETDEKYRRLAELPADCLNKIEMRVLREAAKKLDEHSRAFGLRPDNMTMRAGFREAIRDILRMAEERER